MKIKVLLVDDHTVVLKGLAFFLSTQEDLELVGEANNGKEALVKVGETNPDVVLMDLYMPEMDGVATLAYIKQDPQLHHIPVIMCTGSFEFQEALIEAGACAVLVKPIDQKSLFKIVSQHLPHINETNTDLFSEQSPGAQHVF